MLVVKQIIAVILGYAIFVITGVLFFNLSGIDAHAAPNTKVVLMTAIYGVVFSLLGGLVTQLVAGTSNLKINYILAIIMAGFAMFSLLKSDGYHWTQLLAIFVFSPASVLGGYFYLRRKLGLGSK